MTDPTNPGLPSWSSSPSAKEKNAVQKAVVALLDELAPERVLKRGEQTIVAVEQHRTPTGCVLQATNAAISVSWFAEPGSGSPLGELHITVWRGVVTRRGVKKRENASVVKEVLMFPIEKPTTGMVWRSAEDGKEYDAGSLAAHCLALLEKQIQSAPAG